MSELTSWSLTELVARIKAREVSAVDAVEAYLEQADANKDLNAYLLLDADGALAAARAVPNGPLAGAPIAVKDIICTRGLATTCASRILEGFVPPHDATLIEKIRAAGGIVLGKTNCDEFAMGSSNENSAFGAAKNPANPDYVTGGSSGGSAVAVAADLAAAAVGTDTGGSIRQPASLCGVVGLKPTYGRVSRYGLVAFASSLDQAGPMTKTVADAALLQSVIEGHDERDSTSSRIPSAPYTLDGDVRGLRVAVPTEYFAEGLDSEVETAVRAAIRAFEQAGAKIVEVSLPHTKYAVAVYYLVATAEASSNLARYDGVRYGQRREDGGLAATIMRTRSEGFGDEVKRRIMLGTYALSAGYYDAYYRKAMQVRTLIRRDFETVFEKADVILGPVSPTPAWKIGEKVDDPLAMYLSDIYTIAVNLAGLPGLSVPCGESEAGLPIGLQMIAKPFDEASLFKAAGWWEARSA